MTRVKAFNENWSKAILTIISEHQVGDKYPIRILTSQNIDFYLELEIVLRIFVIRIIEEYLSLLSLYLSKFIASSVENRCPLYL